MLRKLRFILVLMAIVSMAATACASVNGSFRITGSEAAGDTGTITVSFTDNNGRTYSESMVYGQFSFKESVAAYFGGKFSNDDYQYGLTAKAYGDTVVFNLRSASSVSSLSITGPTTSFQINGTDWPSSGLITPSLAVECTPDPIIIGNASSCTAYVAGSASGSVSFSLDGNTPWATATLSDGSATVTTPLASTSAGYHMVTVQYSGDSTYASTRGDAEVLVEGSGSTPASSEIYSFNITGYDGAGNIQSYTHNVDGVSSSFQYAYDALGRLSLGTETPASGSPQYFCWNYDSFGNRTAQVVASQTFGTTPGATCTTSGTVLSSSLASYQTSAYAMAGSNRISSTNTPAVPVYDDAGNLTNDGTNSYLYDAEGRLCAMQGGVSILGGRAMIGYLYDAEGRRVAKGNLTSFSCDMSSNGFSTTRSYALGLSGEQVSETGPAGEWLHTNVNVGGTLLATYDDAGVHYHVTDWLGSRRLQTDYQGVVEGTYTNLPYGEFVPDNTSVELGATEQHFTARERDQESGNDYFGARYYASSMGRFMSPDPSGLVFADPKNPQSLNLYAYVLNNPLTHIDPRGLDCVYFNDAGNGVESVDHNSNSGECGSNGGDWVNGTTYSNLASYNSKSDTWNIASYGNEGGTPTVYWSQAYAPGPGGGGTDQNGNSIPCSGNCDTVNGYSSTGYAFWGSQIANGNWYDALHWAVGQTTPVSSFQKWIIGDPNGRNWCGAGGTGTPSGNDDWACMAHDYNYMTTGNTWPGDNLAPFSGNKQLQQINQTLCNNVSSSNVKNFFTYTSTAGCH